MNKTLTQIRLSLTVVSLFFILLPLLVTIPASFTAANYASFPPKGFSLQWYVKLLERPEFVQAFLYSLQFAVLTAVISVVLGTLAAIGIAKYDIPGKAAITSFLTSPLSVPQVVLGIALLIYLIPLAIAGTPMGFLIAHVVISVPYVVRLVLTGLSGYDYNVEKAAMILGANPWTVFWKITLPLIRPSMFSGALFSFLTSFDNVTVSLFMISPEVRTIPLEIFSRIQDAYEPVVASISAVIIFISAILIVILERLHGIGKLVDKGY